MKSIKRIISFMVVLFLIVASTRMQAYALNDPYISVTIVDTNIIEDGLNKYEIIIHTHAGDLGTTAGTRYSFMEIKTSSTGSVLATFSYNLYFYSGTPYHSETVGYFYLSEDQLTQVYIKINGVGVYNYEHDWLAIYGYSGVVAINSISSSLVDR